MLEKKWNKRNIDIYFEFLEGKKVKDLAHKHKVSGTRIRQLNVFYGRIFRRMFLKYIESL